MHGGTCKKNTHTQPTDAKLVILLRPKSPHRPAKKAHVTKGRKTKKPLFMQNLEVKNIEAHLFSPQHFAEEMCCQRPVVDGGSCITGHFLGARTRSNLFCQS